ncbi:thiol-disulfide isomerase [Methanoculleus sp. FWC-SCC3]|uniref:Thiol-disulfide isomerase n=1 Tax=Methanoculleus methanifontis TaxID=2584086 RepID=A0ABT8LXD7_9EURY|nr:circadian clock KaiB family protein [Methanoculleus sp. FWC-SCC3]MDN7011449.1 thiol-disulfide isomerase [Methanoculleus sp. FWC-SCC3]
MANRENRNTKDRDSTADAFELALEETDARYVLRLYVTGMTPRSQKAIESIKEISEEHLAGRYDLEVIDIYQQPERAQEAQVVATPTLIKQLPLPLRKLIGDMSDKDRVLVGLGVQKKE